MDCMQRQESSSSNEMLSGGLFDLEVFFIPGNCVVITLGSLKFNANATHLVD
jgi:hypothetical protein